MSSDYRFFWKSSSSICIIIGVLILITCIADAAVPAIIEVTPSSSANTGIVTVNFYGMNFSEGITVIMEPENFLPLHKGSIMNGTRGAQLDDPDCVSVSGNYAGIVNEGSHSIEIINVSNPENPVHAGSIKTGSSPSGIVLSRNYAFIINDGPDTLNIFDITDPAKPLLISRTKDSGGNVSMDGASSIVISGNLAYILGGYNEAALEIVDISDVTKPVRLGKIMSGNGTLLRCPWSISVSGDYAYVASYANNALEIVDVSDPANPVHKGSILNGEGGAMLQNPISVWVSGDNAYVLSDKTFSLEIVNVSDPAKPMHKSKIEAWENGTLLDNAHNVVVSGSYAYVTSMGNNALEIIDISNPSKPVHKTSVNDDLEFTGTGVNMNWPIGLTISGDYAYVTSMNRKALEIVDLGTITGSNVTVISPSQMICTFDVTNKSSGRYRIFITNPDGSRAIAPVKFGIGIPSAPKLTSKPTQTADISPFVTGIGLFAAGILAWIRKRSRFC